MINENKKIEILYHLSKLIECMEEITEKDVNEISKNTFIKKLDSNKREKLNSILNLKNERYNYSVNNNGYIEQYYFENVFIKLRNMIIHEKKLSMEDSSQLEWIIRALLSSKNIFENNYELVNFLTNLTGVDFLKNSIDGIKAYTIVGWYCDEINNMDNDVKNNIYYKILNFLLVDNNSNYKEWRNIFHKED